MTTDAKPAAEPTWEDLDAMFTVEDPPAAAAEPVPDGTPAAGDTAPPAPAEEPPVPADVQPGQSAPAGQADEAPAAAEPEPVSEPVPAAPAAPAPPAPTSKPYTATIDKVDFAVPGAIETSDGYVAIPKATLEGDLLSRSYRSGQAAAAKRVAQLEAQLKLRSLAEEKAKAIIDGLDAERKKGRDALHEWADKVFDEWETTHLRVERDFYKNGGAPAEEPAAAAGSSPAAPEPDENHKGRLQEYVTQTLGLPGNEAYRAAVDVAEVVELMANDRRLLRTAAEDMRDDAGNVVLRKGEPYFDREVFRTLLEREATRALQLHQAKTRTPAAAAAANRNAAVVAAARPAPARPAAPPQPKLRTAAPVKEITEEEWDAQLAELKP